MSGRGFIPGLLLTTVTSMSDPKAEPMGEVVALVQFIDPQTREIVRAGDRYHSTVQGARDLVSLNRARELRPDEQPTSARGEYNRRDMRAQLTASPKKTPPKRGL
jgi:hypothetical protein